MAESLLVRRVNEATRAYSTFPTSFQEVARGLEKTFGRGWKPEMAKAISETSVKSDTKYKTALRNVERWQQYERGGGGQARNPDQASAANKSAMERIGKTLDPLQRDLPPGGLTITVDFKAPADKSHAPRTRTATVHFEGAAGYDFVNNPSYYGFFENWFDGGGETYGEGADYEVDVTNVTLS